MKEEIPPVMDLESDPLLPCSKNPKLRCDCYKVDPCPECTIGRKRSVG